MVYIGIDPGASGGIAWIVGPAPAGCIKMPETERDIWSAISLLSLSPCVAVIENVHAMPKQGVTSTFKFGTSYGGLRMALVAAGIPFQAVTPQTWQKTLGCLTHGDKNVSKRKAQELFPAERVTHAVADALLLALYCSRINWMGVAS